MSNQQNIIDFLKGYHPSSPATYKIATSLLSGLSKNSLEELAIVAEDHFIHCRIKRQLKAKEEKSHNTPFKKLLILYTDKKSGRVIPSRNELFRRFPYLDPSQQKRVVEAFFNSSASDVKMMSSYLVGHWDDMYLNIVEKAWLDNTSDEGLAKLIIRYHRLDFVMSNISELEAFNGPMLAVRRSQAGKPPRIEDWSLTDYFAILYNSGRAIAEDEAIYLMKSYLVCAAMTDLDSGRVPDYTRKSDIEHPSLIFLEGARLMVYYLGCMGMTQALSCIEEMDNRLCLTLGDGRMHEILSDTKTPAEDKIISVWRLFCETAIALYDDSDLRPIKVKMNSDATPCIVLGGMQFPGYESEPNVLSSGFSAESEDTLLDGIPF